MYMPEVLWPHTVSQLAAVVFRTQERTGHITNIQDIVYIVLAWLWSWKANRCFSRPRAPPFSTGRLLDLLSLWWEKVTIIRTCRYLYMVYCIEVYHYHAVLFVLINKRAIHAYFEALMGNLPAACTCFAEAIAPGRAAGALGARQVHVPQL